ncbi:hypothetical protein Aperf_G00000027677 [Anoplocephala perfoliata]
MQALNNFFIFLLSIYQTQAIWSRTCCSCPGLEEDGTEYVTFTGGLDDEDLVERYSLSKEKRELLDLHNEYRRRVAQGKVPGQPPSSKIRDLQWSTELEASAQRHANTCIFQHDSSEQRKTSEWWWVGQNIAYSSSIAQNVEMWFEEYRDYNYQSNYCSGVCGHYTQLVWANTTHVGCGVQKCNFNGFNAVYVVCNYGPGGNFNNQRPY